MGSLRIQPNTVLALDLSDIRKEYAQKMENLAMVRDGSTGELHQGYWLCDVTGAEVNGSESVLTRIPMQPRRVQTIGCKARSALAALAEANGPRRGSQSGGCS